MNKSPITSDFHINETQAGIRTVLQSIGVNGMTIDIRYDLNTGMAFVAFIYKGIKYERRSTNQKNVSRNLRAIYINLQHKVIDQRRGVEDFEKSMASYIAIGPGQPGSSQSSSAPVQSEPASADDFKLLDVSENATADEIKKAYRHQMQAWHPDRFINDAEMQKKAQAKTSAINSAYQRICSTRGI